MHLSLLFQPPKTLSAQSAPNSYASPTQSSSTESRPQPYLPWQHEHVLKKIVSLRKEEEEAKMGGESVGGVGKERGERGVVWEKRGGDLVILCGL
jgi:hypothetical protein